MTAQSVFQSLSRDSGRLNHFKESLPVRGKGVSIPQSGFGAFEPAMGLAPGHTWQSFNPSVGIRGV